METAKSQDNFTLTAGTIEEIITALRALGASSTVLAQAGTSFLIKIPGTVVSRIEGGFQVGNSRLFEQTSLASSAVTAFHHRAMAATNDPYSQQAA